MHLNRCLFNVGPQLTRDMNNSVRFPISVTFEDGEVTHYDDIKDLELNLEDFDSETASGCCVSDATGRPVVLKVELLQLKKLRLA